MLLSAETSLTTAAPAATETLFGASTSAASASTSAASTSAATASPSGGECRACRGRHEAHTCSRRGTPHGAGTGRDGKGTTSATSATSAGTATTSLAVMQSPDGKGVQRDRTPTNTARDRREILSELIKREGALPAVVMRGFLQSEMRGDGGVGASASGGGAGQHDGERRGKAVQIDYRTVVRIIGEMEKDGEVRTLEADHPTKKDRDDPARPATMQIVIAAHLADDGPEVQRLLESLSARVATHESVAGGDTWKKMTMRLTADMRAKRRDRAARDAPPLQRSAADQEEEERSDEIAARRDQLQGKGA